MSTGGAALAQEYPGNVQSPTDYPYSTAPRYPAAPEPQRSMAPGRAAHKIDSVKPYFEDQRYLRTVRNELRGARIGVRAEPGLTAEYLQLQLEQRAAAMANSGDQSSPLAVPGVRTHVAPAGDHFLVTLKAKDMRDGKEVLRRAEALGALQP
jgi:hypothetical protein